MILYVNGDSHSAGAGLKNSSHCYASKLAKHYDLDLYNDAEPGASNTKIIRTTREFLNRKRSVTSLLVIGWTTWEREEWAYDGKFYNINSSGYANLPNELKEQYQHWVSKQTPETLNLSSLMWHKTIHDFHLELVDQKIPHLFFNCMYNFFNIADDDKLQWNSRYVDPYNNDCSYYWYLSKQGHVTDAFYHFDALGHSAWADFLIVYIGKNQIL